MKKIFKDILTEIKYILKSIIPATVVFGIVQGTISYFKNVHNKVPPKWFSPILFSLILLYMLIVLGCYLYRFLKRNIKVFHFNSSNGTMWNNGVRNIAFRVKTINNIFERTFNAGQGYSKKIAHLAEEIGKYADYIDKDNTKSRKAIAKKLQKIKDDMMLLVQGLKQDLLFSIGYKAGKAFATDVLIPHYSMQKDITIKEKIDIWCKYDSDVGWGKFTNNLTDYIQGGEIRVEENFLAYGFGNKICDNLCQWLEGYILGIIEVITGEFGQYKIKGEPIVCKRVKKCCFVVNRIQERSIGPN